MKSTNSFSFLYALIALVLTSFFVRAQEGLSLSVGARAHEKMPLYVGIIGDARSSSLKEMSIRIKDDLEFSGQFCVTQEMLDKNPSRKKLEELGQHGIPLAIYITAADTSCMFEWRVYETYQQSMLKGMRVKGNGSCARGWAHRVADAIWPVLTGKDSFFSSKLAYCKDVSTATGKIIKHVCVSDFDGTNVQVVKVPTVTLAPRWNNDALNPLLFYSEHTNDNVRLRVYDVGRGSCKTASDFPGINMLPTFSGDGKKVVYCASRGSGRCALYSYTGSQFERITHNGANNVSPSLSHDGKTLYFCSDFYTGYPQICRMNMETKSIEKITQGGYCASPCYSSKRNQVVYSKIIQGTMQLMVYDCAGGTHTQVTSDAGNKEEACWSACGNYITFCVAQGTRSRIALLNLLTNERRYITSDESVCSYPSWSPRYEVYPEVRC